MKCIGVIKKRQKEKKRPQSEGLSAVRFCLQCWSREALVTGCKRYLTSLESQLFEDENPPHWLLFCETMRSLQRGENYVTLWSRSKGRVMRPLLLSAALFFHTHELWIGNLCECCYGGKCHILVAEPMSGLAHPRACFSLSSNELYKEPSWCDLLHCVYCIGCV